MKSLVRQTEDTSEHSDEMVKDTFLITSGRIQFTSGQFDSDGRSEANLKAKGSSIKPVVILEWRKSASLGPVALFSPAIKKVRFAEKFRTLPLKGLYLSKGGPESASALVYECPRKACPRTECPRNKDSWGDCLPAGCPPMAYLQKHINLRDLILKMPKPSGNDRGKLASIIAAQVRSYYLEFGTGHAGLRLESFVFFECSNVPGKPDLTRPYLLDLHRPCVPSIYEHPKYEAGEIFWFYDVWLLMMILTEIADWKFIDKGILESVALRRKKYRRKQMVMYPEWKSERTADVMRYGFYFLGRDRSTLENLGGEEIKNFYNILCRLLD